MNKVFRWIINGLLLLLTVFILALTYLPTPAPNAVVKGYLDGIVANNDNIAQGQWNYAPLIDRSLEESVTQWLLLNRKDLHYVVGEVIFYTKDGQERKFFLASKAKATVKVTIRSMGSEYNTVFSLVPDPLAFSAFGLRTVWKIQDVKGLDEFVAMNQQIMPAMAQRLTSSLPAEKKPWDRNKAVEYVKAHAKKPNDAYPRFNEDSINFISQALYESGVKMRLGSKDPSTWWWIDRTASDDWDYSLSWVRSEPFQRFLESNGAQQIAKPDDLKLGDLIFYKWKPENGIDQGFVHVAMVTGYDPSGLPLVTSRTMNIVDEPFNLQHIDKDIIDYRFLHLPDTL